MPDLAKLDALMIQVDSEGDPKSVTIWATTVAAEPRYLTAAGTFDTPLDLDLAVTSLEGDADITFA